MTAQHPHFFELPHDEAIALLGRGHIGRLAFAYHDRVDIEPISYVYADGWLYGRTSAGAKLSTTQHHPWVAFEVDEIETRFDWRSVVVRGAIYFLDPSRGARDREAYETAVGHIRSMDAGALSDADPTPHRSAVFRIHVDELTGRGATTRR